jgi:Protein of unknown function (DUF551)
MSGSSNMVSEEVEAEVSAALTQMVADERRYAGSPWRLIATAPKDGTPVLGWWGTECMIVDWCVVVERWGSTHDGEDTFLPEPTHWMPLPEGPGE